MRPTALGQRGGTGAGAAVGAAFGAFVADAVLVSESWALPGLPTGLLTADAGLAAWRAGAACATSGVFAVAGLAAIDWLGAAALIGKALVASAGSAEAAATGTGTGRTAAGTVTGGAVAEAGAATKGVGPGPSWRDCPYQTPAMAASANSRPPPQSRRGCVGAERALAGKAAKGTLPGAVSMPSLIPERAMPAWRWSRSRSILLITLTTILQELAAKHQPQARHVEPTCATKAASAKDAA